MNSRVQDIYSKLGTDQGDQQATRSMPDQRFRLAKKDLMKVLEKMPEEAAIWNTVPGQGDYDAKNAIRDALWETIAPAVRKMVKSPSGEYIESK